MRNGKMLILMAASALIAAIIFFSAFGIAAKHAALRHYIPTAQNAIKHASAAATCYKTLRNIGISANKSYLIVLYLGLMNERVESVIKYKKPDTTREVAKDLFNNAVGISAMEWISTARPRSCLHSHAITNLLSLIAKNHSMIINRQSELLATLSDEELSIETAKKWYISQHPLIVNMTNDTMQKLHNIECSAVP